MRLRRMLFTGLLATAFVVGAGCRYDWTYADDESEGGTSPDGSGTTDGSTVDSPVSEASPPPPSDATGPPVECSTVQKCAPLNVYCAFADNKCGKTAPEGTCKNAPACESQMACACSGGAMDKCLAYKNGSDIDLSWAACGVVDYFKCGNTGIPCKRGSDFCQTKTGGVSPQCVPMKPCALGCACTEPKSLTSCACDDKLEPGAIFVTCP